MEKPEILSCYQCDKRDMRTIEMYDYGLVENASEAFLSGNGLKTCENCLGDYCVACFYSHVEPSVQI